MWSFPAPNQVPKPNQTFHNFNVLNLWNVCVFDIVTMTTIPALTKFK